MINIFSRKLEMAKEQRGGSREGAVRKPTQPEDATMTISVTVPNGLVKRLDEVGIRQGWNRSEGVREAIKLLLKRHE